MWCSFFFFFEGKNTRTTVWRSLGFRYKETTRKTKKSRRDIHRQREKRFTKLIKTKKKRERERRTLDFNARAFICSLSLSLSNAAFKPLGFARAFSCLSERCRLLLRLKRRRRRPRTTMMMMKRRGRNKRTRRKIVILGAFASFLRATEVLFSQSLERVRRRCLRFTPPEEGERGERKDFGVFKRHQHQHQQRTDETVLDANERRGKEVGFFAL